MFDVKSRDDREFVIQFESASQTGPKIAKIRVKLCFGSKKVTGGKEGRSTKPRPFSSYISGIL